MSDHLRTAGEETADGSPGGMLSEGQAATSAQAITGGVPTGRQASLWTDAWLELRHNPLFLVAAAIIAVLCVIAAFPGIFTNTDPRLCDLANSATPPTGGHPFGYDVQGCDYLARVIYGARVSILVGVGVAAGALTVSVVGGCLAGYYGGFADTVIARMTDIWFAVPTTLGAIVIFTRFPDQGLREVTIVLIVLSWPTMLRLMRSSVLSAKEADYVQAARALGATDLRILRKHILPNAIAPVIVYGTILVGIAITAEASLSFLGVGLQLPSISWGLMIGSAQSRFQNTPHLLAFPALFLSITVFSFILLGDALRDALDPKLR